MFRHIMIALTLTSVTACSPLYCQDEDWDTDYSIDNSLLATMFAEGETDPATIACETACEVALDADGWGTVASLDYCEIALIENAGDAPTDIAATATCRGRVQPRCD